eukprot:TRINITY_DN10661_c0_g1_i1.p1 TRINITY_DN10661_c0_g1~~TRINITY_DN10661_c0_g1_i1.p1  ORF type:complete len:345 (-),score=59.87 TRINITY_DN10661_c0_g1_i1:74-1108(-)
MGHSFVLLLSLSMAIAVSIMMPVGAGAQRITTFNIDDFGADYTGNNDSSTAIQAAVNAAADAGGGTVIIPPGNYRLDSGISITTPINIQGSSPQSSVLVSYLTSSDYAISVQNARGFVMTNFGINCVTNSGGIYALNSFMASLINIQISSPSVGIWIEGTGNVDATSITIWSQLQYGIRLLDLNGDTFLNKIHINCGNAQGSTGVGLYLSNVSGGKFTDSDFIGGLQGVLMDLNSNQPNPTNEWNQFLSVDCDTVGNDPWHIEAALGLQLSECWSGTFLSGTGIWLGSAVSQVSIVNHQFQNGMIGVGIDGATEIGMTGGIIANVQTHLSSTNNEPTVINLEGW